MPKQFLWLGSEMSKTLVSRLRLRPGWSQGLKSQYQSKNLRLIPKVSVSIENFEAIMQKSQSHNAIVGLAHHRFWNLQRKLISCQLSINFYVRMCAQGHNKVFILFLKSKGQYQSQYLRLMMVSVSVSIFDTKDKSLSISLNFCDQFIKSQSQS